MKTIFAIDKEDLSICEAMLKRYDLPNLIESRDQFELRFYITIYVSTYTELGHVMRIVERLNILRDE